MDIRQEIEIAFGNRVFERPLFYSYPGGLRFELSEGGTYIQQFLLAIQKAKTICDEIFGDAESFVLCVRRRAYANPFAHRPFLREFRELDIKITRSRSLWLDPIPKDDWFDDDQPEYWVTLAFEAPAKVVPSALWCAVASDFGYIQPNPHCQVYLMSLSKGLVAFPYDDRGMDVVGTNRELLAKLYTEHHDFLLPYDLERMAACFGHL